MAGQHKRTLFRTAMEWEKLSGPMHNVTHQEPIAEHYKHKPVTKNIKWDFTKENLNVRD